MTRDEILATIHANEGELRGLQVRELALFGSFAREKKPRRGDACWSVSFRERLIS